MTNVILRTDSYKLTHWKQYPEDTTHVYSYFEDRVGAEYTSSVFFGLQPILESLAGPVVTAEAINEARELAAEHFMGPQFFNKGGWEYILQEHGGRLPLEIRAVAEGTVVPISNVLMTVVNTDPMVPWLTNAVESVLTHVWYPKLVATKSRAVKQKIADAMDRTVGNRDGLEFMLHDFGYRGATGDEAAAVGGAGHLVNFKGTDTLLAIQMARQSYDASLQGLAYSVPATEHSVMTAKGRSGELGIVDRLLDEYPTGILSIVADSYNVLKFVDYICTPEVKAKIMARDGKVVVRPDSITPEFSTPPALVVEILQRLWKAYGGSQTQKGYNLLDPHIGCLWGDGLSEKMIGLVLTAIADWGFAASNMVFGMGGGLLQKGLDRDTQRCAFKCSAMKQGGQWVDIWKDPLEKSKASKRGVLALVKNGEYSTVKWSERGMHNDLLETRFLDGKLVRRMNFDAVRNNAQLDPTPAKIVPPANAEVVR